MLPRPSPQSPGPPPSGAADLPRLRLTSIGTDKPGPADTGAGLADLVDDVVGPRASARERVTAVAALTGRLAISARTAGVRAVVAGRWLADVVTEVAPHLVVRDAAQLRQQFPGLSDDAIAARLVVIASRLTAGVGGAAGAMSAAEFVAPPALMLAPVQLAAETLAVVAVELRLVAELHEIAGRGVPGGLRESAPAYLQAWVRRRAVAMATSTGLAGMMGDAAKRDLRKRLLRRMGRSTTSMAPMFAGALAGAEVNRRSTRDLGERMRQELFTKSGRHADIVVQRLGDVRGELGPAGN